MSNLRVVLVLMFASGCGAAADVPPPLPELATPIPGPPPPPPKPEFDSIVLSALDQSGEPLQRIRQRVEFRAKLSYKLKDGSVAIDRILFQLVAPRDGVDIICDQEFGETEASSDDNAKVSAILKSYPKDGAFAVTASIGPHEIARIPLEIDDES